MAKTKLEPYQQDFIDWSTWAKTKGVKVMLAPRNFGKRGRLTMYSVPAADVGFTGTHYGINKRQRDRLTNLLLWLAPSRVHLGDCVGADATAHALCLDLCVKTIGHLPDNNKARAFCVYDEERTPLPYLERNQAIDNESLVLVACPRTDQEQRRSGTWATVRYARKAHKPVIIIKRNGKLVMEKNL